MARKPLKNLFEWVMWIAGTLASIGIAGLFLDGTFMNVAILKIFPLVIHQIVGRVLIITTVLAVLNKVLKLKII